MKAVFFLCLTALGLVLVQTQKPKPYFTPFTKNCKLTKLGREYAGSLSVTKSGLKCQSWNSDSPLLGHTRNMTTFPEGSASGAGNKCRNPNGYVNGLWCHTDVNGNWEECDVKFCDFGCKKTSAGREYAGPQNVTKSGRVCQRWDSDFPNKNSFKAMMKNPDGSVYLADGSVYLAENKCRNPDENYHDGVWCYTTDPLMQREACDVEFCPV